MHSYSFFSLEIYNDCNQNSAWFIFITFFVCFVLSCFILFVCFVFVCFVCVSVFFVFLCVMYTCTGRGSCSSSAENYYMMHLLNPQ